MLGTPKKVEELDYKYKVIIHSWHNSNIEACEACKTVYTEYLPTLTNTNIPKLQSPLNKDELHNIFVLDSSSPSGLSRKLMNGKTKHVGSKVEGTRNGVQYYNTIINGESFSVHRIIMTMCGFNLDGKIVDHIDGNGLNNDILNLRVVSGAINARNTVKNKANNTGVVGVSRNTMRGIEYYVASWIQGGKLVQKRFSIKKLGEDGAYQRAVEARKSAFESLKNEGYGYTERHGT